MKRKLQQFGGDWTGEKLECVRGYLGSYTKIMRSRRYKFAYIDAFAGTGYRERRSSGGGLFKELGEPEVGDFLSGSARIALEIEPPFHNYIFIEKDKAKVAELEKLRDRFPNKKQQIDIRLGEANNCLTNLCRLNWKDHRAVLFIDPFGMQLAWETIAAIAKTKAIDTWILFPVSAVVRLLRSDGNIPDSCKKRLDTMFGEPAWFDVFFPVGDAPNLFDAMEKSRRKVANVNVIGNYFNKRLKSVFAGVAPHPLLLRNSKSVPLFLLFFAAGNPNAVGPAIKIASHLLK